MRGAYGWAMIVALFMLSFLPVGSPSPEELGTIVFLGLIAAGAAVLLAGPRRWWSLRRTLSRALDAYALLIGIKVGATALVFGLGPFGPAELLSYLLAGTLPVALIVGGVAVRREASAVLPVMAGRT